MFTTRPPALPVSVSSHINSRHDLTAKPTLFTVSSSSPRLLQQTFLHSSLSVHLGGKQFEFFLLASSLANHYSSNKSMSYSMDLLVLRN